MRTVTPTQIAKVFPLKNPLAYLFITQPFAVNIEYYKKLGLKKGHDGLDLRARTPKECLAVCDGVIRWAGTDNTGGKGVKIETREITYNGVIFKLEILYYHLSKVKVKQGQKVKQGKVVGLTGNSGKYTTAPHLHFSVRVYYFNNGKWVSEWDNGFFGRVNPIKLIPGEHLPVDDQYGKKRNWILEYTFRFASAPRGSKLTKFLSKRVEAAQYVHRRLKLEGRIPPLLTDRETNAIIYGSWGLNDVLEPAMYQTWSQRTKSQEEYLLNKRNKTNNEN